MHDSVDSTVGNVLKEGIPFLHNFGMNNTFLGSGAGNFTMAGYENTAIGSRALFFNTGGKRLQFKFPIARPVIPVLSLPHFTVVTIGTPWPTV